MPTCKYNRFGEQKGQRQLWAMIWKIHLNLPKTNSPKVVERATQSWTWNIFFKPCVLWDYKEKEENILFEVIWSLGATLNLTQFYFKVEVK